MIAPVRWAAGLIDAFAPADTPPPGKMWPFAKWALRGSEPGIIAACLVALTAGFAEMAGAWLTGWVIDTAVQTGPGDFLSSYWPVLTVAILFFLIIRPIIFAADAGVSSILLAPHLFPLILSRLNRYTLGQSMRFFENDFAGRISQKAMQTSRALTDVVVEVSDVLIYGMAIFVGTMLILASVDPRLLLGFGVWAIFYVSALLWFIPRVQARSALRAGARTVVTGQIVDTYSNIATVKLFAHDAHEDDATRAALGTYRDRALEFGILSATYRLVLVCLGGILPLFALLGSLWLWSIDAASAGDIAMAAMAATRLSQVTQRLGRGMVMIFTHIGEVEDGVKTLTLAHEITDRTDATDTVDGALPIRFEHVDFSYGRIDAPALRDLQLAIAPGERVALVGASGAGKSTVVSLLLRLYDVESGQITIGDTPLTEMTQSALRGEMAVVRQETAMFNRSALDNIRYGRPEASDEDVFEAARLASAHDFIIGLKDHRGREGYGAFLGERGVKLSGGQRQRIALARAIVKDAPILVLDEATSALDSEVESEIQAALETLMQGKTVLAIAHRLSTIARMDRIIVMDQGRIVEEGTHKGLLKQGGLYARYWNRQSGGFLGVEQDAAE